MSKLIDADALWMDIIHAMDYCDDVLEIIEQQPTVEQKTGKWTPCSERFPDSNGEYLVTIECEGFTCIDTDTYSCYGWKSYGIDSVGCVIAWMPLPKPYTEDKQ